MVDEQNVQTINNQYLAFKLADEIYAIEIGQVREVLEFISISKVPNMPEFMRGVINLRGAVVPVVDLRLKFGMTQTEKTIDTCIIIVDIMIDSENTMLGVLADSVLEVIELESTQIEPPPKIGLRLKTDFIKGMGKQNEQFLILLDIDHVFSTDELLIVRDGSGSN